MDSRPLILKDFLRDRRIPLSGNKAELVRKVSDIFETDSLENDIGAVPYSTIHSFTVVT